MRRTLNYVILYCVIPVLLCLIIFLLCLLPLRAHEETAPWSAGLTYIKDERTKACFAMMHGRYDYGPYFTYVPCELVDKADWHFYSRKGLK